ncbi:MAG TPA: hypothetical protein VGF21_00700 [Thermoleophilaceae bacterium]|jgi:hypothetical protein
MASNDPTDTGGLFVGRRPGTGPVRYRSRPERTGAPRQRADSLLAFGILVLECLLCLTLFGPQPAAWLWVGSQVQYLTGFVTAGITSIMVGCCASLFLTVALCKRLDHAWKLVRRAAGHKQERGALERIFVLSVGIATVGFCTWLFLIHGPGSSLVPGQPA